MTSPLPSGIGSKGASRIYLFAAFPFCPLALAQAVWGFRVEGLWVPINSDAKVRAQELGLWVREFRVLVLKLRV